MTRSLDRYTDFHALHRELFVIAPTWDTMSAALLHGVGFKAIATSSVGLGFANGVTSDEVIPFEDMLQVIRAITSKVDIAVSIDMETGYADTEEGLAENVRKLIDAGVVGLNLEDNSGKPGAPLVSANAHADRIRVILRTAEAEGVPLFVNARTDGYWIMDDVPPAEKTAEAIRRGNVYLAAGAHGVFVSGPKIPASEIGPLAAGIDGPLNLLMQPEWPAMSELRRLGLKRLSLGSWHLRAVFGFMTRAMANLNQDEDFSLLREYALPTPVLDKVTKAARRA